MIKIVKHFSHVAYLFISKFILHCLFLQVIELWIYNMEYGWPQNDSFYYC